MSIINKINLNVNDINYVCVCNKYFKKNLKTVILYPCSHILHSICYVKTTKKCPFCNAEIKRVIHEDYLYKYAYTKTSNNDSNNKIFKQMIINL